jgi:Zn finger protein HypA/HybF involved in hydrogenase expression
MLNFEQFKFFCRCGEELATNKDRKVTCPKCKKSYEIELLPQKYLFPKEKDTKQIDTIS